MKQKELAFGSRSSASSTPSITKGAEDWGEKRQSNRQVYQTSFWMEQDGEDGGGGRRDPTAGGSKCSSHKSIRSRKSKYVEGSCHQVGASYDHMPVTIRPYPKY